MTRTRWSRSRLDCLLRAARCEPLEARQMLAVVGPTEVAAALATLTFRGSDASVRIAGAEVSAGAGQDLQQSTSQIRLDQLRADPRFADIDGSGYAIVILDTGADLDHPAFGPDANGDGRADRIVYSWDFADQDFDAGDRNGHGTNVASIAAGINGIAPGADLIVLKVVEDSGFGTFGDVEAALQWVVANVANYNIAAVNMSLSDNTNRTVAVGDYGVDDELAALSSLGVTVVSAAGNIYGPSSSPGIGYPAADPHSLAVGATWDGNNGGPQSWSSGSIDFTTGPDRLTSFSQRHATLSDLFAPGAWITGAGLNGGTSTYAGTSQATPHVAGAVLLAQQLAERELGRRLTTAEVRSLLATSGHAIVDGDDEDDNVPNTGLTFSRLDVYQLALDIETQGTIHVQSSSPSAGEIVATPPASYVIRFSEPPNLATLAASDLRVNGIAADTVQLLDAVTAEFHFFASPVTSEGAQLMAMAAGSVTNAAGKDLAPFSATFQYDMLRLNLVSSSPAAGATATLPLSSIRLTFNEAIHPQTVQPFDLLLDRGAVTAVALVNDHTVEFAVAGLDAEGPVNWSLTAGALADAFGNPSMPVQGSFTLDVDQIAIAAPRPVTPLSSLAHSSTRTGLVQSATDVDRYLVSLEAGQKLSVLASTEPALRAALDIYAPNGALTLSLAASATGAAVLANSYTAATNGAYVVAVRGQGGSQGAYTLEFLINAAQESERHNAVSNDSLPGAQNLDPSFVALPGGGSEASVLGTTDADTVKLGPDGFGYEAFVVPFDFIDISTTGAGLFNPGADNWWAKLTASQLSGFAFPFYGTTYSELFLDTNGHITFSIEDSNPNNTDLTLNPFMATIAVLWDDLVVNTAAPSRVYWQVLGSGNNQRLVIQWHQVRFVGAPANDTITFQVVLDEADGAIRFNYLDLDSTTPSAGGARATVGIKDVGFQVPPQGLNRLLVSFDSGPNAFVGTGQSVRIVAGATQDVPPDHYAMTLVAGQPITLGVSGREYGAVDVELLDSTGAVVATSTAGIDPARVIRDFKSATGGVYYARISGDGGVDYALHVTRGATLEVETNDALAFAQSITATGVVAGTIGYGFAAPTTPGTPRSGAFDVLSTPLSLGFSAQGSFGGPTKGISYAGIEVIKVGTVVSTYTVSLNGVHYTNGTGTTVLSAFPVTLKEFTTGGQHGVRISGTIVPGVLFERLITWNDGQAHALVTSRITNQTGATLANVALLENQDPDPGQVLVTHNDVSASGDRVTAWSSAGAISLGSLDPRAVVSAEGFVNKNPFDILDSPSDPNGAAADIAINLAFRFGAVPSGASVESTFAIVLGGTPELSAAGFDAIALSTLPSSDDYYSISVAAGDVLSLSTLTPGAGNSGVNGLDPRIELYNPAGALVAANDNGAGDGRNAKLTHTAAQSGTYTVRVVPVGGTFGAYQLLARGYTGAGAPSFANLPPQADAGGPYAIVEGQGVTFDASRSFDPDAGDTLTFRWDLDADGDFDDGVGMTLAKTWSELTALGIDGRTAPWSVRVQVDDGQGHVTTSPAAWLTVANTAPSVTMAAPSGPVVRAFANTYHFFVSDPSPGDLAAGFTYEIDWNADGVVDLSLPGGAGISASWTFTSKGPQAVHVRAIDRDGGVSATFVRTIDVQPWAVVSEAGQTVLKIGGTTGDDVIVVGDVTGGPTGSVFAALITPQDNKLANFSITGHVVVAGGDGNDRLIASSLVSRSAMLLGEGGHDLLVGGAGNDVLLGGAGNDLLLAGRGGDVLFGEDGEDLLLAGRTAFDLDFTALTALRNEWISDRSYATRIANLMGVGTGPRANGNYFLKPGETLFDDSSVDQLLGGAGLDWLIYDAFEDGLFDLASGESILNLHDYPEGGHTGGGGQSL